MSCCGPLRSRRPPRGHLVATGCPEFVVEFNNYSINVDDPMSLTSLLHGAPHIYACILFSSLSCSLSLNRFDLTVTLNSCILSTISLLVRYLDQS